MILKTAVAIRHIHFEDLGTFEAVLTAAGYRVHYYDLGVHELWTLDPLLPDLLIVLGGPVGVHEEETYPFLIEEREIIGARLAANRATLGICLGAQQIAQVMGAAVVPSGIAEIGFSELTLTAAGKSGPLRHLEGVSVLHWHGDTCGTPSGAENLASTRLCANQAFAYGNKVLGLQFHPEADACSGLERWLVGHAVELRKHRIDPSDLRKEATKLGPKLRDASGLMLNEWLNQITR